LFSLKAGTLLYKKNYDYMESLYNISAKCTLFCLLLMSISACNFDYKNNKQPNADEATKPTIQQLLTKVETHTFNIQDTFMRTNTGKQVMLCVPIETKINKPIFNISISQSPLHGILTPSVSGNVLCFNYTPEAGYAGLDKFNSKVCLKSPSFCEEKTWYIEVKNDVPPSNILPPTNNVPTQPVKPKAKKQIETVPPSISAPVPAPKSIFDPEKKNSDGYAPKNNN
jgi:hypothetical protein